VQIGQTKYPHESLRLRKAQSSGRGVCNNLHTIINWQLKTPKFYKILVQIGPKIGLAVTN